jgi:hypothetical protein
MVDFDSDDRDFLDWLFDKFSEEFEGENDNDETE